MAYSITVFHSPGIGTTYPVRNKRELNRGIRKAIKQDKPFQVGHDFGTTLEAESYRKEYVDTRIPENPLTVANDELTSIWGDILNAPNSACDAETAGWVSANKARDYIDKAQTCLLDAVYGKKEK